MSIDRGLSDSPRRMGAKAKRVVFGAAFLALSATSFGASAQSAAEPVCLAKTDETGGRMRFVVLEADAGRFERAGFVRFQCPTITRSIIDGQEARCTRLRRLPPEFADIIKGMYGMTIDEMCGVTDVWAAATRAR